MKCNKIKWNKIQHPFTIIELYAIWQALLYMSHWTFPKFLIRTDSLSAIAALENIFVSVPEII